MSGAHPRPDAEARMDSPIWRICNIYSIKNKKGKRIPFRPNRPQRAVLKAFFIERKKKLFIPKARQLGISTLIGIIILDAALFGSGVQCSISDYVGGNARKKLARIIDFGFEALPPEWRGMWEKVIYNRQLGEWRIKRKGADVMDESVVFGGDQPRGDTYQILHLSELGETQVKAPERAKEIFEGALETAELEHVVIETTWHGGKVGVLYSLVKEAMETPDEKKDIERDYFILFFPWFEEPNYVNKGDAAQITTETRAYFASLSGETGREFSDAQMLWYQKKKRSLLHRIYSVYPSRLSEIFLAPVDGAIYASEIDEARVSGRILPDLYDRSKPVHTLWDFGSPKNTIVVYFQIKEDGTVNFIEADVVESDDGKGTSISGLDLTLPNRVSYMKGKGYTYGTHYLPHDGGSRAGDLRYRVTWQQDLINCGLPGKFTVIPRVERVGIGINKVKTMFDRFRFDTKCSTWVDGLAMYRYRVDPSDPKKFTSEPLHDFASHLADPLRVLGEGELKGYVSTNDIMNTNTALDPIILSEIAAKPVTPTIGEIEGDKGYGFRRSDAGWMNMWELPIHGARYIGVLHDGSAQVWKAPHILRGEQRKTEMVASVITPNRFDNDIIIEWAAKMFNLYQAITVATINDDDSIVRELVTRNCSIYARSVADSKRPIGRQRPARKPGFDLGEPERSGALTAMVRAFRDRVFVVNDAQWLAQAETFVISPSNRMEPQEGYLDNHIVASAIAVSLIDVATEFSLPGERNSLLRTE